MNWKTIGQVMLVCAVTGCAPKLYVNVLQPAEVNLGAAKKLSVMQSEGRRSAREQVIQQMISQARSDGYFTVADRSEEGITVKVAGRSVNVTGGKAAQPAEEIGLRIDVLEWSANKDTQPVKDSKGNVTGSRSVWAGKVLLGVTAFNAAGKAYLAEKEYEAKQTSEKGEDEAIKASADAAVRRVLHDITPTYVQKAIRLDDADESQKPIIEMAKNGSVPQAIEEERGVVQKNPNSAPAVYNLAVLLDSQGQYKEALDFYGKAITLASKDFYVTMKTECAKRLADAEALASN
jgi:tetratricopeptide (TPR) repeat protein